jgi:hypothetical protein
LLPATKTNTLADIVSRVGLAQAYFIQMAIWKNLFIGGLNRQRLRCTVLEELEENAKVKETHAQASHLQRA